MNLNDKQKKKKAKKAGMKRLALYDFIYIKLKKQNLSMLGVI